jgi:Fe-S cluster assembly protein SufD
MNHSTTKFLYNRLESVMRSKKPGEDIELVLLLDQAPQSKEMTINLVHESAYLNLVCLVLAKKDHKIPIKIKINHAAPRTESLVFLKGVAADSVEITAGVMAHIAKGARAAKTKVVMKMLLVGESAKAKPSPALEIEENEVTAGHAASVGRLDEEQLFYLMSRGLSKKEAEQLLINGFIEEVFEKIKTSSLKKELQKILKHN